MFRTKPHSMLPYIKIGTARIITILSQFALLWFAYRLAGSAETGIYASVIALSSIVSSVFSIGQITAGYRNIPSLLKAGKYRRAHWHADAVLSLLAIGILTLGVPAGIAAYLYLGDVTLAIFCLLISASTIVNLVLSSIARSYGYAFFSEICRGAIWPLFSVLVLLVFFLNDQKIDSLQLLTIVGASTTAAMVIGLVGLTIFRGSGFRYPGIAAIKKRWRVDYTTWVITLSQTTINNLDVLLVGSLMGPAEAGVYFGLTRIGSLASLPLTTTNPVILPVMSRIAAGERDTELVSKVKFNTKVNFFAPIMVSLILIYFSSEISFGFIGERDIPTEALYAILVGQCVNSMCGPSMYTAQLFHQQKLVLGLLLISFLLMVLVTWMLYAPLGIIGIACASASSRVFLNLAIAGLLKSRCGLNIFTGVISAPLKKTVS